MVYAARCTADREAGLSISSKASKILARYDILKDKGIAETCAGCLALIWLPQVILGKLLYLHLLWDTSKCYLVSRLGFVPQFHIKENVCGAAKLTFILVIMWRIAGFEDGNKSLPCWSTGAPGIWGTAHSISISVLRYLFSPSLPQVMMCKTNLRTFPSL